MSTRFTTRYTAYASSYGRTPRAQLAHDAKEWPGGKMAGFTLWIRARWEAYAREHPEWWKEVCARNGFKTDEDHAAFDTWLTTESRKVG